MDTEKVRETLTNKLLELEQRLTKVKADVSQSHSTDFAEQAQERENDEVIDAISTETLASIAQIKAALQRIEAGNYGLCEHCGEQIDARRLAIVPEARLCTACA